MLTGAAVVSLQAQGPGGGRTAQVLFAALDKDSDGTLTKNEIESGFNAWFTSWGGTNSKPLTQEQIAAGLSKLLPAPPAARPGQAGTFNITGNSTPIELPQQQVDAMMGALPQTPGVKPLRARKVLVLAHTGAGGFVHASIPLAAKTVEALGNKGDLWTTTVSYDPAVIDKNNLKQYDAIFLDSTTACFLDDKDPSVTAARRAAFLGFVRSGKGIVGIHAASDAYHTDCLASEAAGSSGSSAPSSATVNLSNQFVTAGDKDNNRTVSRAEWAAIGDDWFQKLDANQTGKISQADFVAHFHPHPARMPVEKESQSCSGRRTTS